jgi:hypothetical protein
METDQERVNDGNVFFEGDIREISRLLGRVAALEMDQKDSARLILTGFAQIIRADGWAHAHRSLNEDGEDAQLASWRNGITNGDIHDLFISTDAKLSDPHIWQPSDHVLAAAASSSGMLGVIAISRTEWSGEFSPRDRHLFDLLISQIPWLLTPSNSPVLTGWDLPPRLSTVLLYLLRGAPRKEIAAELGVLDNTVQG